MDSKAQRIPTTLLAPALGYYLSTNSFNPEMGVNKLDMMLTLVRGDINSKLENTP